MHCFAVSSFGWRLVCIRVHVFVCTHPYFAGPCGPSSAVPQHSERPRQCLVTWVTQVFRSCLPQYRSLDRDWIGHLIAGSDLNVSDVLLSKLPTPTLLFPMVVSSRAQPFLFSLSGDLFSSAQCDGIYYWGNTREKTYSHLGFSTKPTRFIWRIFTSRFSISSYLPVYQWVGGLVLENDSDNYSNCGRGPPNYSHIHRFVNVDVFFRFVPTCFYVCISRRISISIFTLHAYHLVLVLLLILWMFTVPSRTVKSTSIRSTSPVTVF